MKKIKELPHRKKMVIDKILFGAAIAVGLLSVLSAIVNMLIYNPTHNIQIIGEFKSIDVTERNGMTTYSVEIGSNEVYYMSEVGRKSFLYDDFIAGVEKGDKLTLTVNTDGKTIESIIGIIANDTTYLSCEQVNSYVNASSLRAGILGAVFIALGVLGLVFARKLFMIE